MKFALAIPPVVALVVVMGWSSSKYYSISILEKESDALKALLIAHSSGSGSDASSSTQKSPDKPAKEKKPINLKKLAAQLAEVQLPGSKLAMMRLEQQYQGMTKEELVFALDEIDGSDTPSGWSDELKIKLLQQLCQKDPESALARYIDQLSGDDSEMTRTLAFGMREWSQKDPAKATAWLDEQIAAGKFNSKSLDGKSQSWKEFEGALIGALVSTDPAAAAARLSALPEGQRISTLLSSAAGLTQVEGQLAFANFIRAELPEKDRTPALAHLASKLINGEPFREKDIEKHLQNVLRNDYTPVTDFLNRINATPDERVACVEKSALTKISLLTFDWNTISREQIDTTRAWVMEQAPSVADKVTGIALMSSIKVGPHAFTFAQAAELATQYSDESGNNGILIAFLSSRGWQFNKDEARLYAEKISDPERRQVVLDGLK